MHANAPTPSLGDPALLAVLVDPAAGAPERTRALHLLGLRPCTESTLLAVLGPVRAVDALEADLAALPSAPRRGIVGSLHAVAVVGSLAPEFIAPEGLLVGVGTTGFAVDAPASWEKAVRAVRYATAPTRPVVFAADLGPFELLAARLRSSDIHGVEDIDAIDSVAAGPGGRGVVTALETVAQAGSLREAARVMCLHHTSVAARLSRAEQRLGYRVTTPSGMARLQLALALRRLRGTDLLA
ncbi:hypothetical protein B1R94_09265 [Mycolicibacterium litorale]|nr:hypothetical protein B1R94_09265 [Mycolicibacterium litorale]